MDDDRYYHELATAFARGRLRNPHATIADAAEAGLRLHKFKSDTALPRVQRVLGILRAFQPNRLLDIGSGRGTFLWPLLHAFPTLPVTAVDHDEQRASDLIAVHHGGIHRLTAVRLDAQHLAFANASFDAVTILEVLEHLPDSQRALTEAVRVAKRAVILSVPSVPDDNPQHLRLFSPADLQRMATAAGATRLTIEHVLNHRIAVLKVPA